MCCDHTNQQIYTERNDGEDILFLFLFLSLALPFFYKCVFFVQISNERTKMLRSRNASPPHRKMHFSVPICEYLCAPPIPTKWNNESTKKTIFETITFKCARTRSPYSRYIRSQLQSGLLCCYICKRSPNALENQINSVFDLPLVGLINAYR